MINLQRFDGRKELVNPTAIARVSEASAGSQYHGIRSIVTLFNGQIVECNQTVDEISVLLAHSDLASA